MAKNHVQEGSLFHWTNSTGANKVSGQAVVIGNQIGVCLVDIANGASGSVQISEVFTLPKTSGAGTAIAQGAELMWKASTATFVKRAGATPAAGDVTACCVAAAAAGDNDTTVAVKLNVGVGVVA